MPDTFYRDFEARFRGAPAVISERLRVYEPFLMGLAAQSGPGPVLDLGCGRGEWLEVVAAAGFDARGVDLDEEMLGVARAKGLNVERMDALDALRAVPDEALAIVSAFHVIEHLDFDMLRIIISEAKRALRLGGILILETPNPENPLVGLVNFYLDPTHRNPIPPQLARFLVDHAGFARSVILRLQGAIPQDATAARLSSLLSDVSLDYAVVGQVEGADAKNFDAAFEMQLGMDLQQGLMRFDDANAERIDRLSEEISDLRAMLLSVTQRGLTYDPEALIIALYKLLLRRTPAQREVSGHVNALLSGKIDLAQTITNFIQSSEYARALHPAPDLPKLGEN